MNSHKGSSVATHEFVTFKLDGQLLGLPVQTVRDILKQQHLTRTPLAPDWIAGLLNLRGRIVTAIDLRRRLGLPPQRANGSAGMSIVVEHHGAPYCLLVDSVSDVLTVNDDAFEANPVTLDPAWQLACVGVYRLPDDLLVILDIRQLLDPDWAAAA